MDWLTTTDHKKIGSLSGWRKFRVTVTVEAAAVGIVPSASPARQAASLASPTPAAGSGQSASAFPWPGAAL
ncbi:hypothetical protein [Streptomyces sp. NRRL S-350]|uniref:hypothetical protein n=1 Tax=Streptomyces sp. NRRL S-350 TaxID=1463902 RepID=UPI00131B5336|nr:hypothetical protein [Streptomyces sp. NRRL S-350]